MSQRQPPGREDKPWYEAFQQTVGVDIKVIERLAGQAGSAGLKQCKYKERVFTRLATGHPDSAPRTTSAWLREKGQNECTGCPVLKYTHRCAADQCGRFTTGGPCHYHGQENMVPVPQPFKWCLTVQPDTVTVHMRKMLSLIPIGYKMSPSYLAGALALADAPEIDPIAELSELIVLQRRRLQKHAGREINEFPVLVDQVGKEIMRQAELVDMLSTMLVKLGVRQGVLPSQTIIGQQNIGQQNVNAGLQVNVAEGERLAEAISDRIHDNPNRMAAILEALQFVESEITPDAMEVRGRASDVVDTTAKPGATPDLEAGDHVGDDDRAADGGNGGAQGSSGDQPGGTPLGSEPSRQIAVRVDQAAPAGDRRGAKAKAPAKRSRKPRAVRAPKDVGSD